MSLDVQGGQEVEENGDAIDGRKTKKMKDNVRRSTSQCTSREFGTEASRTEEFVFDTRATVLVPLVCSWIRTASVETEKRQDLWISAWRDVVDPPDQAASVLELAKACHERVSSSSDDEMRLFDDDEDGSRTFVTSRRAQDCQKCLCAPVQAKK